MNKENLVLKPSRPAPAIDWSVVEALAQSDGADEDSPELTTLHAKELRPLDEVLPLFSTGGKQDGGLIRVG